MADVKRTEKKVGCSLIGEISWRFGAKCSAIWRNMFGYLEKTCSAIWRKHVRRLGENVFGAIMAILYWSSLWSSIELGDHKWGLNHNGEKVKTSYGDQNFIQHKVESTYLERLKDRNI